MLLPTLPPRSGALDAFQEPVGLASSRAPRFRRAGDRVYRKTYHLDRSVASPFPRCPPSSGWRRLASWVKSPRNAPLLW